MPDLDVAWQRTRAVIPVFQEKARAKGATSVKGFAQALLLATNGGQQGICYGMAVQWILAKANGARSAIETAFISAGHGAETGERDGFYGSTSGTLHQSQFGRHQSVEGKRTLGYDHFERAGLAFRGEQKFDQRFYRMTKAAQWIAGRTGYFMINTPNHAMAASAIGGVYCFFDPNLGEAEFGNSAQFQSFFSSWMSETRVVKAYRGTKGGRLDNGGAHKTLHLSIDHYS